MRDFLSRLAARSLGVSPVAQPVVPPMFAPGGFAERFEPAPDSSREFTAARTQAVENPTVTLETTTESAPAEATRSSLLADATQAVSPMEPANAFRAANVFAEMPDSVTQDDSLEIKSKAANPSDRMPTIAHGHSERETASDHLGSRVSGNGRRPLQPSANLVTPGTFTRSGRETPPSSLSRDSGAGIDSRAMAPVIRVTIGRVDVRAEFPAAAPRPAPRQAQPPTLSVEEYAKQRNEGKR